MTSSLSLFFLEGGRGARDRGRGGAKKMKGRVGGADAHLSKDSIMDRVALASCSFFFGYRVNSVGEHLLVFRAD